MYNNSNFAENVTINGEVMPLHRARAGLGEDIYGEIVEDLKCETFALDRAHVALVPRDPRAFEVATASLLATIRGVPASIRRDGDSRTAETWATNYLRDLVALGDLATRPEDALVAAHAEYGLQTPSPAELARFRESLDGFTDEDMTRWGLAVPPTPNWTY